MARINSNVPSLVAQFNLGRANGDLETRLQRLATGVQLNRGADNPAGLIISERLRSEIQGIEQAVKNSDRASAVIATTEGGLNEVSDLLNSIKALVVEAANTGALSDEERAANQLQIDSAIDSITRISNSTSFGGLKLLNGELDYVLSGINGSEVTNARVFGANFAAQPSVQVDTEIISSAQNANVFLSASTASALTSTVTVAVAGPTGVQELTFVSGTHLSNVVAAINSFTEATGVSAAPISGGDWSSGIVFSSTEFGSGAFVSVDNLSGTGSFNTFRLPDGAPTDYPWNTTPASSVPVTADRDEGRDVVALVNGVLAAGDGLTISVNNSTSLSLSLDLESTFAQTSGAVTTFDITGGGALFQLGGDVNVAQQSNLGVQSVAATRLGGTLIGSSVEFLSSLKSGGANDLRSKNFANASQILVTAIDEASTIRGRLGAFEKNTIETNVRSLQAAMENLVASDSIIRDADFAKETTALSRAQILNGAATSVLGLANQQAQSVLQLLG